MDITLTVPDNAIPRIREAFGKYDILTDSWSLATVAEVRQQILSFVKSRVIEHEAGKEAMSKRKQVSAETW